MNTKIEVIASELQTLMVQFEEKKYYRNEENILQFLKENGITSHITITECHVISCIASIKEANGITIAKKLKMTRGGISKITNRLIEKNLITAYKDEINKKKIFYKLTPLGEKVDKIHNQLHQDNYESICTIASNYTIQEQDIILRFIKDLQYNYIK